VTCPPTSTRTRPRAEILSYLEECSREFGISPHLKLGTEVTGARFDAEAGRWTVTTDANTSHEFDVLVTACGQLTRPAVPRIEGIENFEGPAFHSAEWDHEVDLKGRRVAVIGTGASAIQLVPEVAEIADRTTIYQRSAPWILPRNDRAYPRWERALFRRFPARVAAARVVNFALFELLAHGLTGRQSVLTLLRKIGNLDRRRALGSRPDLLAAATPDYEIGCKRVLISSDWYPTLMRDDVELIAGAPTGITAGGVIGPDGVERAADAIIYGTGFQTHNFVAPMEIHGLGGRELNAVWDGRAEAFLGTTVSGFPNLFVLYGPNTNHGAGSVPFTLESQFNYVLDAIRRLRAGGYRWIDLRPEAQEQWRAEMADRSANTVWTSGGCANWYLNSRGENTNNWPGPWLEYRRRTRRINPGHYRVAV
jgi:cation diffusion facilitator CzcD-associated flavoprotein CzcO